MLCNHYSLMQFFFLGGGGEGRNPFPLPKNEFSALKSQLLFFLTNTSSPRVWRRILHFPGRDFAWDQYRWTTKHKNINAAKDNCNRHQTFLPSSSCLLWVYHALCTISAWMWWLSLWCGGQNSLSKSALSPKLLRNGQQVALLLEK